MRDTPLDDATIAVVAHGLLNSLAVVEAGFRTLIDDALSLPPEQRDVVAAASLRHLDLVAGVLRDLTLGLSGDAVDALSGRDSLDLTT